MIKPDTVKIVDSQDNSGPGLAYGLIFDLEAETDSGEIVEGQFFVSKADWRNSDGEIPFDEIEWGA